LSTGDSYLVPNILPPELADGIFERLREEVSWNIMKHRGESGSSLPEADVLTQGTGEAVTFPGS
jgi:hypothetical protein